jgi:multiple antibiotic resistance protein
MEDANSVSKKTVLILVVAVIMLLTYVILYSSSKLIKVLGQTGINVMMRIMGLIVMVIAVEFFFSGIGPILQKIISHS